MLFYIVQVDIDLIDPDGVFQLKAAPGTNAIMADDDDGKSMWKNQHIPIGNKQAWTLVQSYEDLSCLSVQLKRP